MAAITKNILQSQGSNSNKKKMKNTTGICAYHTSYQKWALYHHKSIHPNGSPTPPSFWSQGCRVWKKNPCSVPLAKKKSISSTPNWCRFFCFILANVAHPFSLDGHPYKKWSILVIETHFLTRDFLLTLQGRPQNFENSNTLGIPQKRSVAFTKQGCLFTEPRTFGWEKAWYIPTEN